MVKAAGTPINIAKAREAEAKRREESGGLKEPEVQPEDAPQSGPPVDEGDSGEQGMPLNLEELFATLGVKDFENQQLRRQLNIAQQQVRTLSNIIKGLQGKQEG